MNTQEEQRHANRILDVLTEDLELDIDEVRKVLRTALKTLERQSNMFVGG